MKYLALDIGNVLCHLNQDPFADILSSKLNISVPEVNRFLKRFWELHDLGFTRIEDELIDRLGVKSEITLNELTQAWNEVIVPSKSTIDFVNYLRIQHDVKIALLSNMGLEHKELMKSELNEQGLFDSSIKHFSCEVGARKPSKVYYQSFLWENPEFKGCLYVDDLPENLKAGEKFGFTPFHFSLRDGRDVCWERLVELKKLILA